MFYYRMREDFKLIHTDFSLAKICSKAIMSGFKLTDKIEPVVNKTIYFSESRVDKK